MEAALSAQSAESAPTAKASDRHSPRGSTGLQSRGSIGLTSLAIALVALIGFASGASPWQHAPTAHIPGSVIQSLAALLGAAAAIGVLGLWLEGAGRFRHEEQRRKPASEDANRDIRAAAWVAGKTLLALTAALFLFVAAVLPLLVANSPSSPSGAVHRGDIHHRSRPAPGAAPSSMGTLRWFGVGMATAVLLTGPIAATVAVRRRRRRRLDAASDVPAAIETAIRDSIAELESQPDPWIAISRAYVRMEEAFASVEVVRRAEETPSEFLPRARRVLSTGGASVAVLTELVELAKFSEHDLTATHRRAALVSLRRVESELAEER